MSRSKLGFHKLNAADKVAATRNIITKTTGNPDFPVPNPSLAALATAANDVENAESAASGGGKKLKTILNAKIKALVLLITLFIAYVDTTSGGDATKILSTGLNVRNKPKRSSRTLKLKSGPKPGSVIAEAPGEKARSNKWQYGYDPNFNAATAPSTATVPPPNIVWVDADDTTTAKITIENLKSGSRLWLRHAVVKTKAKGGQGPWTDPVSIIVP